LLIADEGVDRAALERPLRRAVGPRDDLPEAPALILCRRKQRLPRISASSLTELGSLSFGIVIGDRIAHPRLPAAVLQVVAGFEVERLALGVRQQRCAPRVLSDLDAGRDEGPIRQRDLDVAVATENSFDLTGGIVTRIGIERLTPISPLRSAVAS